MRSRRGNTVEHRERNPQPANTGLASPDDLLFSREKRPARRHEQRERAELDALGGHYAYSLMPAIQLSIENRFCITRSRILATFESQGASFSDPSPAPAAISGLLLRRTTFRSHRSQSCFPRREREMRDRECPPGRGRSRCLFPDRSWRRGET